MAKEIVEMAAEIVNAQAGHSKMSADDMAVAIGKLVDALRRAKTIEEGALAEAAPAKPLYKRSVFRSYVVCLECGTRYKRLTDRHLGQHGLDKRTYKDKYGIRQSQKLVATALTARRRKMARERGLAEQLAQERREWATQNKRRPASADRPPLANSARSS